MPQNTDLVETVVKVIVVIVSCLAIAGAAFVIADKAETNKRIRALREDSAVNSLTPTEEYGDDLPPNLRE